jgi:glycogen debranching enzyme
VTCAVKEFFKDTAFAEALLGIRNGCNLSLMRHGLGRRMQGRPAIAVLLLASLAATTAAAPIQFSGATGSGLVLRRPPRPAAFFDVVGRRAALFGYEGHGFEAWVYPLKLVDDFRLAFKIDGYPLELDAAGLLSGVEVRPEATTFTYSHAAFSVRQILFAPVEEPGAVMLLEVRSALPLSVIGSFRPRLKLMWPAGLMTGNVSWDEKSQSYAIVEETKRFAAVVGSPGAQDLSVMPYQEEPRDVPIRFVAPPRTDGVVPVVIAGSVEGKDAARATYDHLLASAESLLAGNAAYYRSLLERSVGVVTPDPRLNEAFAWAKVGIDKGLATNPTLGTGLLAGFRTSGDSERPGFGWYFGRDALWTALAIHSYGDFATAREALDFLRRYQRADGKIPHEISQSASLLPWFTDYPYPWNAADATPLYVIAHADHFRATGDRAFLDAAWDSIVRAYRFTAATDTDGNGLVENTTFGHGWVEGGALYPPHEEIYMQGVWVEACRALAELADARGERELAGQARAAAERTRVAMEGTYWLADRGFFGFATARPRKPPEAEPGPNRERRQARMDELKDGRFVDEDTALPAVPLWWRTLDAERAQSEIDHLGGAALATDWGTRLLSSASRLYDPLSYHYGSVWPLFTGWVSMAAYRYGRPHVGYQALMANALLTEPGALGYVTELLSGDFNAPFGRSSHHQVWSEAMVVTPLLRGLFGIEARDAGRTLSVAPQLPADWERAALSNLPAGGSRIDVALARAPGRLALLLDPRREAPAPAGGLRISLAPAFPLDARVRSLKANGRSVPFAMRREGDLQLAEATLDGVSLKTEAVFELDEGTDVAWRIDEPELGASSQGLRVLRSRAEAGILRLALEGLAGRTYPIRVRSPRQPAAVAGVSVARSGRDWELGVRFDGTPGEYVRRDLAVPLR